MINSTQDIQRIFFIGIAGTGMSALAQYLQGCGKAVYGSDRNYVKGQANDVIDKLHAEGIKCFYQDGSGLDESFDIVVVSTAIEDSVYEVRKARDLGITILKRSELLAMIAAERKTIAIAGTSGKSTTCAMLFDILTHAGYDPGIISGAGLTRLINNGKIGNAHVGKSDWLIIEADESDGSIVHYQPEIGVVLNIDKDHQDIEELIRLFSIFKSNTKKQFIVNRDNSLAASLSVSASLDFCHECQAEVGYTSKYFVQDGMEIQFSIHGIPFLLHALGKHNLENALAAIAVAHQIGISFQECSTALQLYEGIYRRHQYLGTKNGVIVIDDYAHNPVKCSSSIRACQPLAPKLIAWFQPHGYGPTRFLKDDFICEFIAALRPDDEIWMSEIYYAGGTAVKDISSNDLITAISLKHPKAYFIENRNELLDSMKPHFTDNCVLLLMGARDPSLETFTHSIYDQL